MNKTRKILIVDDEPEFLQTISNLFRRKGLEPETAGNCAEALDKFSDNSFDVVIMDVSMPGLNGLECMAEMKAVKPDIEVIILTGHGSINFGLGSMKKGAFDYCLKPVEFEELLEKTILAEEKVRQRRKEQA